MKIMFNLMNEARIEVGLQGLGTATAAYEHAVEYAKERLQGAEILELKNPEAPQVPIIRHADVRRQLLWMKAHVEGCRALLYYTSFCQDMMEAAAEQGGETAVGEPRRPAHPRLQGLRDEPGPRCLFDGDRCLRRIRLLLGVPRGAVHAGLQDHPDLRRHQRHPGPRPGGPQAGHQEGHAPAGHRQGDGCHHRDRARGDTRSSLPMSITSPRRRTP